MPSVSWREDIGRVGLMGLAVLVAVVEAVLLVGLAFAQFEGAKHLSRFQDPLADPLVSNLRWIGVFVWLAAPPLIGLLVARSSGRVLPAAGLAFGAVACSVVGSPLLQQLAVAGWIPGSGQNLPEGFFFAPPIGWSLDYAIPLLMVIGVPIGGGVAALEAALVAGVAQRLARRRIPAANN